MTYESLKKYKSIYWIVSGSLLAGIVVAFLLNRQPKTLEYEVAKIDQVIKTTEQTKIVQTVFYEKCKEDESTVLSAKAQEVGLNYHQFQALYPQWNIEIFNAEQIKMSLLDAGCCKEHQKHKFIGAQGDYVAIFYGMPNDKPVLKELTKIKLALLHAQALEEVQKGIIFQSNEEMLQVLEGLHSK